MSSLLFNHAQFCIMKRPKHRQNLETISSLHYTEEKISLIRQNINKGKEFPLLKCFIELLPAATLSESDCKTASTLMNCMKLIDEKLASYHKAFAQSGLDMSDNMSYIK